MTSYDALGASADSLDRLITLTPDPERAERVRVRCRERLGRNRRRTTRTAEITGFTWRLLGPVVVSAVCVVYAALLVATTLRLEGIFN